MILQDDIEMGVNTLKSGGIVIFPTDTAFGIGCRMDYEKALRKLFQIRRRPLNKPLPVLVSDVAMAKRYMLPFPDNIKILMGKYWPGGLTIVYFCNLKVVPELVRGGTDKIGMRMPKHQDILEIIQRLGVPIVAPSANFHGYSTPYSYSELDPELISKADFTLPGECLTGKASTVVDCTVAPWKILRSGAVSISPSMIKTSLLEAHIDTTKQHEITITLRSKGKNITSTQTAKNGASENILQLLKTSLENNGEKTTNMSRISLNTGPGSFTGLRVGAAVANALGFLLQVPVNSRKNPIDLNYSAKKYEISLLSR